jgi:hypothetical protein
LTQQQKQLDKTKPVSQKLSGYIDRALAIMKVILDTADQIATPETRKDAVLDAQMAPTTALSQDVSALLTTTNLLLQKAATTATGPATPQTTTSDSSDDDASGAVSVYSFETFLHLTQVDFQGPRCSECQGKQTSAVFPSMTLM